MNKEGVDKEIMEKLNDQFDSSIKACKEDDSLLQEYSTANDTILICFIESDVAKKINPVQSVEAKFLVRDELEIEYILNEIKKNVPDYYNKKMFLLVHSNGGLVQSGYKISKLIRNSFKDITVFVPQYAISAGTMLSLVGNRIRMGDMSQLGPLDTQIIYKNQYVSINSMFSIYEYLNKIFSTEAVETMPYTLKHLTDELDPLILSKWSGIKEQNKQYVQDILFLSGYKNYKKISSDLITGFPTHDYVVQYDLAKKLELKVEKYNVDIPAWKLMNHWLYKYNHTPSDTNFIRYVIPK